MSEFVRIHRSDAGTGEYTWADKRVCSCRQLSSKLRQPADQPADQPAEQADTVAASGKVYNGGWKHRYMHGQGRMVWPDGRVLKMRSHLRITSAT